MLASLEAFAQQLVEFVRLHEAWAAPVVFALAFGESLAFISLLIPAWAALVGIGVLISSGNLNFWPIWVAGSVGAALDGDRFADKVYRRAAAILDTALAIGRQADDAETEVVAARMDAAKRAPEAAYRDGTLIAA